MVILFRVQSRSARPSAPTGTPSRRSPTRQRQMNAEVTARLRELQTTIEAGECCLSSSQCPNACFTVPVPLYPE